MDAAEPAGVRTPDWAVAAIVEAGRRMDLRGWVSATAGNISVRLDADRFAITRSGGHKGYLDAAHVMQVSVDGHPLTPGRPSAETGLHAQLYRMLPAVGAIVHGHSIANTVLSLLPAGEARGHIRLSDRRAWLLHLGSRHADRLSAAGGAGIPARLRA